jgi:hypothetical protein
LTGSFLESDASGVGDACIARHGPKSRCFLSFGCRKLGTGFTFACASVAWEEHLPECFGSPLQSSRRMTKVTDGRSRLGTAARYRLRAEIELSTNPAGRCHILCFARATEPPPRAAIYTVRF